ncbi:MAG: DUF6647 family protein [Xanthobacteraceae bacterium]
MIKILVCVAALALVAVGPLKALDLAPPGPIEQSDIERTEMHQILPNESAHEPQVSLQPLLTAMEAWLAFQFDLPSVERQPHIKLAPPGRIAALRYQGLLSGLGRESAPNGASELTSERDIVAVYSDEAQTIFLPEGWTGTTPAELSILVHELVHHVQNVAGLKYACPQEREKVAYAAQERWLGLFGHTLERDFELDGFSLLVKTRCFH